MTLPTPWQHLVRLIEDGQNVDASSTNKPHTDLVQRTQHLKDLLDLLSASEALFVRGVPVRETVAVGQPVYLHDGDGVFDQALVALDLDANGNWGVPAKSAYAWGVVVSKSTNTVADVATTGLVRGLDITAALRTGQVPETGPYFLSAREAGKIERVRAPAAPFVLYHWAEEGLTWVMPDASVGMIDHVHYRFQLVAEPAGTPNNPDVGEKHEITSADASLQGWLPADDPVFAGMAPTGAKFGYNLAKHPELASVFPPLPPESAFIEVYGSGWGSGREPEVAVKVDANGIWWMLDDYGWAPWSVDYWEVVGSPPASGGDPAERPAPVDQQPLHGWYGDPTTVYTLSIFLWFSKLASKTNDGVVASLRPCEGSPIRVLDCNCENEASSGHLRLALDLQLGEDPTLVPGGVVFKGVSGTTFVRGWVTEGVKSLSSAIQVAGDAVDPDGYAQGRVTINYLDPNTTGRELDVSLVALDNAREESQFDLMYLGFPPNKDSSIRGKIEIPKAGFSSSVTYELALRFWILGTAAGTLPDLGFSYRHVPEPLTTLPLPSSEDGSSTLALNTFTIGANQYLQVETDPFVVTPGETLFFTLLRAAEAGDGYTGKVGILRQRGIINPQP